VRNGVLLVKNNKRTIPISSVVILTALYTLYNVFITWQGIKSNNIDGDRLIYSLDFHGVEEPGTLGLALLIKFLRLFTDKSTVMFYLTTVICSLLTFIAYRKSDAALPAALVFLVLTQWLFSTFINIKQCYSTAFAALFFVYALRRTNLKNTFLCIVFIALASLFHQSGFMLIFVYAIIKLGKTRKSIFYVLILCVLFFLFFDKMALAFARVAEPVFPSLSSKINQYFMEHSESDGAVFAVIKGLPFFYITFVGLIRQKYLVKRIKNYNKYLKISIVASLVYFLSIYNDWLFRLIYMFYFPVAIFFGQIIANNRNRSSKTFDCVVVFGSLFVVLYRYIILMYVNYGGFSGVI